MVKRTKRPAVPLGQTCFPWLLAVAAATTLPHFEHLSPWLSATCLSLWLWCGWRWKKRRELPGRLVLGLLIGLGTAAIAWEHRTLFGRDAGVALLCFFMALKPLEMRTRRDAVIVVMLGFFLLLTHYLYAQGIPTALWLLLTTVLLIATLTRLHGGDVLPASASLRQACAMLSQALPLMLALFILFPRIEGPLWGLPRDAFSGMTGLSEQMSPGSLSQLTQSAAIAFRVRFDGVAPEHSRLYWRGPVLEVFDGRTWSPRLLSRSATTIDIEPGRQTFSYTVTLEPHNWRWLLALDLATRQPPQTLMTHAFEVRSRTPIVQRSRYAFTSTPEYAANRRESADVVQTNLRLPGGYNPQARKLAEEWRSAAETPEAISDAALRFFRNEPFHYTLQPPLLGHHTVDDFLFVTRRGFCEHYASAYVFLMRAAGIPARVVTGYQGGETNPIDGYLTLRQSDAHAWAEIWLANRGWTRVDPTAAVSPLRIERGIEAALPAEDSLPALIRLNAGWLRDLRDRWEATNNAWNQWVLGYNPERQREFLFRMGMNDPSWRNMAVAMTALCAAALLTVVLWTRPRRRRAASEVDVWQRICAQLEVRGVARGAWEGPFAYAARVARERPDLAPLADRAARHFAALHYGTGQPQDLQQLNECLQCLKRTPKTVAKTQP